MIFWSWFILVLGILLGISITVIFFTFYETIHKRKESYSCFVCKTPLSTEQILYGDGTCSKVCSNMASGIPMPWEGWNYPDPEEYVRRTKRRNRPALEEL